MSNISTTAPVAEPLEQLKDWLGAAAASEPEYPEAAALATCDSDGQPAVRMVLIRQVDERGCVFYTNLGSAKARHLQANPEASLAFHWKSLNRQVRVSGTVEPVSAAEADAYFAARPRTSQLGAWASRQSESLDQRSTLEARVTDMEARFAGQDVPRPDFWSGFRLIPAQIEFWQEKPFRLHDRKLYMRDENGWQVRLLYP